MTGGDPSMRLCFQEVWNGLEPRGRTVVVSMERPRLSMEDDLRAEGQIHYQFKLHERVSDGVMRIALEQIGHACELLVKRGDEMDDAIHEARVSFKKVRALLRLVRRELGRHVFKKENKTFREAGRRLSGIRDSAAVIETFDRLTKDDEALTYDGLERMRARLVRAEKTPIADKEQALSAIFVCVEAALARVADWPIDTEKFAALAPGLRSVYRKGGIALDAVLERPTSTNLHELRRRVKDLTYQIHLLRPVWPGMLKQFSAELKHLAHLLSEHHDLAVLRQALTDAPAIRTDADLLQAVLALVDRRQQEIRIQAMPSAERIYLEKPRAFVRRIGGYWEAWRPETT